MKFIGIFQYKFLSAYACVCLVTHPETLASWHVLSGDKEVAMKMVFMYTFNTKKYEWWEDITLLVWGPSAKLLTEDEDLQKYVKEMLDINIEVLACKGCADLYGISEKLEELGVTVRYTGVDLTNFIKERHVITF